MQDTSETADPLPDVSLRYVRVTRLRPDGFVEFDFAIGDPALSAELILGRKDFESFCALNATLPFPAEAAARAEAEHRTYLYGDAGATQAT
ncbi:MAG: phenol hydroxylase [Thauera sp.]|nr:phenol hydroxylase [Thauera sp.]